MPTRRSAILIAAAFAAAIPAISFAAAPARFTTVQFDDAKTAGGPVLVHIHAPWCPTCRAQQPILAKLLSEKKFSAVKAFEIDYDGEKMEMRLVGAKDRSTVIVFKGGAEVGRSVGDTTEPGLEALLSKAL